MSFAPYRPRNPLGCAICGFPEAAAIHQPPPGGARKRSRLHTYQPKPSPALAELNQARDDALKEIS